MPLSPYLKIWPCREKPGHFILYSTKRGAVVRLTASQLAAVQDGVPSLEVWETLSRLEIWCDDPAAERQAMFASIAQTNGKSARFHAQIVLALDCNLACPYCYEDHFRGKHYMSRAVADQTVGFLGAQLSGGRDLEVDFYGGEPLLAVPQLKEVAGSLTHAALKLGRKFSFFLFTNGTLLTRRLVEELLPFGLRGALLTLDGPKEIHNRQRPFVSGKGSFDLIVANIRDVCDLIEIELGGNYNRETYRHFPLLLDQLLAEGITPDKIRRAQFSPIMPKSSPVRDGFAACAVAEDDCITVAVPFLRREIAARGFRQPKPRMGVCPVELDNFLVINYDGSLYKCPTFMGWPELSIGTLSAGIGDYSASHNISVWQNEECLDCPYLPLCFGGCRLIPLLKNGAINELDCRREFLDATLEQTVLQDHYRK